MSNPIPPSVEPAKAEVPLPVAKLPRRQLLLVYIASFLFVLFFQFLQGAYLSEFGGHPDEAAHCITGLFVHDAICTAGSWVGHGMHGSPVKIGKEFADHFYGAYPKIGLGIWPPFFYAVQSVWISVFSASRSSLLLLMAAIAAGLGVLLFKNLREEFGDYAAGTGLALFISLPLIQNYSAMVMAEMLSGLLMFGAALSLGRFLDRRKTSDAISFGLLAALAILTKGTGLALALVALLSLLMTRKWELLRSLPLWGAGAIVAVLAGPWTWFFRNQGKGGWEEPSPSWHYTRAAFPYYLWKIAIALGLMLLLFAIAGFLSQALKRRASTGKWSALGALILSVCIFQSIAPAGREARHLVPAIPALLMFVFAGVQWLADYLTARGWLKGRAQPAICAGLLALFFVGGHAASSKPIGFGSVGDHLAFSPFVIRQKGYSGFAPVITNLLSRSSSPAILVSSDARGEGMLIAEAALSDPHRPSFIVQRASKFMAASTWGGGSYQNYYENEETLMKALVDSPIQFLVIDFAVPAGYRKPHHEMLARLVVQHPEVFKPLQIEPILREGIKQDEPIHVCRVERGATGG